MYLVLELHKDGDDYLKYIVRRVDPHVIFQDREYYAPKRKLGDYCNLYKDKVVLFKSKAYLNGEVVSNDHQLSGFIPRITVDNDQVEKLEALHYMVETYKTDEDGKDIFQLNIYGNVYYICETDGLDFDINKLIAGYGSF